MVLIETISVTQVLEPSISGFVEIKRGLLILDWIIYPTLKNEASGDFQFNI